MIVLKMKEKGRRVALRTTITDGTYMNKRPTHDRNTDQQLRENDCGCKKQEKVLRRERGYATKEYEDDKEPNPPKRRDRCGQKEMTNTCMRRQYETG